MRDVDVVVIGSGAGGLTAAVALAQAGKKVLVLEQHYLPGGWCHSFTLDGYRFSPGVHYIGELGPGGRMRAVFEGLGLGADLELFELNPDGYDHVHMAGERFDFPRGRDALEQRLAQRFPHERAGIGRYLEATGRIAGELGELMRMSGLDFLLTPLRAPTVARWGLRSAAALIGAHVQDPLLRSLLAAQAGDHGLPPSKVPAAVHAAVAAHYFDGGFYPRGGAHALPRAYIRALRRAGGELRVRTPVKRILMERGRAVGVELGDGTTVRSDLVVSNADPHVTYGLVGREHLGWGLRAKLARTRYSVSALSLFLVTDLDVRAAGLDSGNTWWYDSADLDGIYGRGLVPWEGDLGEVPGFFLTATTLKDPTKSYRGRHTLEAFTFVHADNFRRWASTRYGERPDDYQALKADLKERMLRAVEHVLPGVRDHVVLCDLGTPLTNRHYVGATAGNLYGTEKSRFQVGPFGFPLRTPIDGLWMCGASTLGHGVLGAVLSGLVASAQILRCSTRDLLHTGGPELTLRSAEDYAQVPLVEDAAVAHG